MTNVDELYAELSARRAAARAAGGNKKGITTKVGMLEYHLTNWEEDKTLFQKVINDWLSFIRGANLLGDVPDPQWKEEKDAVHALTDEMHAHLMGVLKAYYQEIIGYLRPVAALIDGTPRPAATLSEYEVLKTKIFEYSMLDRPMTKDEKTELTALKARVNALPKV